MFQRVIQFLKEVRVELRRVNWPTREEAIRYTLIVIGVSLAVGVFLGGLDFVFATILNTIIL
ncbi:preprotein translocase subunit SecE [Candidatus Azambacteria bacterium]|nr:preprotein translocase subunit SecE [Candidatus Azambacteria bacterium]